MTHTRTSLAIIIVTSLTWALAIAPRAEAYVTPEQVLRQTESLGYESTGEPEYYTTSEEEEIEEENLPSGIRPRKIDSTYRVQQSKGPHVMLKKNEPQPEITEEEEEPEEALLEIPEGSDTVSADVGGTVIKIDARTARILERLSQPKTQILTIQAAMQPTHTGAPLAPTGPATVAAMSAMLVAIYGTVRRAGRMKAIARK